MFLVRRATIGDLDGLVRVHVDTWKTTYKGILPDEFLDRLTYAGRRDQWVRILSGPDMKYLFVAEDESGFPGTNVECASKVVGFASGGPNRDKDGQYKGEVYAIYILKDYQGKGLGRSLFTRVSGALLEDGFDSIKVWVLTDNAAARRFYEALGGKLVESRYIKIGGASYEEVAYGWPDARILARFTPE
ncbi:MAG: GNAT family N-acetyltransferase [Candidatus Fermentithermobacillus carboniphilus]|uniref:GNAT family N-acetyltransferase n=1 Tax=Candidatus Fermentithermobacillus carboniphilus TaxID=3085328 RepID=A0AAT9LE55_9FIRM|nr:MAG: GNAT family N-acetyltransferase [Candidatus Fermentithermobacillus carboniphilus]